ncbi:enolase-phosphatase E1-like protein [Dinothrombium tinctorium]|uniref:Enolase-phosphatase E1-like protein n=1 Tax=Dinothrombium tinctorium TaxID=1965070 RepID=A0A3S3P016_9ACAR|nr:enolase-phosphatase E1-like protein [Dinothrombium tinctorium]RWS02100.1 enolase-phosphatase E1-like protein [Dinothrombium tinctorium]RWS05268.1 enolase-phosphatase E1-like protein [Dinothrombium tinctorium]
MDKSEEIEISKKIEKKSKIKGEDKIGEAMEQKQIENVPKQRKAKEIADDTDDKVKERKEAEDVTKPKKADEFIDRIKAEVMKNYDKTEETLDSDKISKKQEQYKSEQMTNEKVKNEIGANKNSIYSIDKHGIAKNVMIELTKPDAIILRLYDVISSWKETKRSFISYTLSNLLAFLDEYWEQSQLQEVIQVLRIEAYNDRKTNHLSPRIFKASQTAKAIKESILFYMNYRLCDEVEMTIENSECGFMLLMRMIWHDGYLKGKIKTHVYSEVAKNFLLWRENGIKIYIFSCCSVETFDGGKRILSKTIRGDLTRLVDGYFDTQRYDRFNSESYLNIAKDLCVEISKILFITKDIKEARAARNSGMQAVMIFRNDSNVPYYDEGLTEMHAITELNDIHFKTY